jgi:hypothetical protein
LTKLRGILIIAGYACEKDDILTSYVLLEENGVSYVKDQPCLQDISVDITEQELEEEKDMLLDDTFTYLKNEYNIDKNESSFKVEYRDYRSYDARASFPTIEVLKEELEITD